MDELHFWSAAELGERLRRREVSAVEVARRMLARIEAVDGRLHSYVTVMAETALAQAARADSAFARGEDLGPLQGVPVAVKDCIFTRDAPTTVGSPVLAGYTPREDATVVRRLEAAGAVLLGKLALTEGTLIQHWPSRPAPVNPWRADVWTGVSSSGSAVAAAAGLAFVTVGTDTGGSIRLPAAACNLTGLKPTYGRVSVAGLFPMCPSRDHMGPMARDARDAALLLAVMAGEDPADPISLPEPVEDWAKRMAEGVKGLRLGVDASAVADGVAPELAAALKAAIGVLQGAGAEVREIAYPSAEAYMAAAGAETAASLALVHEQSFAAHKAEYGSVLRGAIERAARVSGSDVVRAETLRARFKGELAKIFSRVDLVLLPVQPQATPTLSELAELDLPAMARLTGRFTLPLDATGHPAMALPCGFDAGGRPLSMQLVAPHLREASLFRAAAAYQTATDWHMRRPHGAWEPAHA